jgi:hypothetical protein
MPGVSFSGPAFPASTEYEKALNSISEWTSMIASKVSTVFGNEGQVMMNTTTAEIRW